MQINLSLLKTLVFALFVFAVAIAASSCTSSKKINYFTDLPDSALIHLPPLAPEGRVIENGDLLEIGISARSSEAAGFFNKVQGSASSPTAGTYLVDDSGYLEFPILGKVRATGSTADQLKENLTKLVTPYLKEPIIEVRYNTFKVTILGEVRSPGTHTLSMQRTTLFEALGSAGDLPNSAKKYDVLLYRDYNGQRTIRRIDLRTKDVLTNKDVFYVKHNDVFYIQARPSALAKENFGYVASIFSIVVGVLSIAVTLFRN